MSSTEAPRMLLYPPKSEFISDYWREKYEQDASRNWNRFYQRNADRFFKDRHYLDKEWGHFFSTQVFVTDCDPIIQDEDTKLVLLEVGCGAGNTVFPLLDDYPNLFIYACDFAPRAVDLVKAHPAYNDQRVHAFVCDATSEDLRCAIPEESVDAVTLIFMLSAVSPAKMSSVLHNIKAVLKPGGCVLVRDYASGDLAQERLNKKDQKISENFYVRGDGTRSYYFTEEMLTSLFLSEGFTCEEMKIHSRSVENRARELVMHRRWIQGAFRRRDDSDSKDNGETEKIV